MSAEAQQADRWQASFGARLRELRLAAGFSQMELAEAAGLHPTYVSSVERGRRNISLVNIHMLARALTVHPARLLDTGAPVSLDP